MGRTSGEGEVAPETWGQGDPLGRGAKSQTRTGFVTLNNCLLYGPSSVALCQQLLFPAVLLWAQKTVCFSPGTQGSWER